MDYVLAPGAWMAGWLWDAVASRLRQNGHDVHPVSLSGLNGEQDAATVRLAEHVRDVVDYIRGNELKDVVLVGHSYSGLVVGQVAAQVPDAVAHTVYVEAFLPVDGLSLLEVAGLDERHERDLIAANAGLWPPPTRDELNQQTSLNADQRTLLAERLVGHPGHTVTDPVVLPRSLSSLPSTFIASKDWLSDSREASVLHSLRGENNWTFISLEGGHWPMLTVPEELTDHLLGISGGARAEGT